MLTILTTNKVQLIRFLNFQFYPSLCCCVNKADLLSRSFLAVTRNRRVERPSSAQPRLCAAHRQQRNNVNLHQVRPTSARALSPGRENAAQYSGGAFYPHGWRPGSSESVRSLPVGLSKCLKRNVANYIYLCISPLNQKLS